MNNKIKGKLDNLKVLLITNSLIENNFNITKTAKSLKIAKSWLYTLIDKYNINLIKTIPNNLGLCEIEEMVLLNEVKNILEENNMCIRATCREFKIPQSLVYKCIETYNLKQMKESIYSYETIEKAIQEVLFEEYAITDYSIYKKRCKIKNSHKMRNICHKIMTDYKIILMKITKECNYSDHSTISINLKNFNNELMVNKVLRNEYNNFKEKIENKLNNEQL